MKFLPLAFAVGIASSSPTLAQGVPENQLCTGTNAILGYTGLGTGGFSCSQQGLRLTSPGLRAWIITGANPESEVTITVDNTPIIGLNAGNIRRSQCQGQLAWTMPEYAGGYPIPEPMPVNIYQSAYSVVPPATATLTIEPLFAGDTWQPNSNYSLNILCNPRDF